MGLAGSERVELPDASHLGMFEQPGTYLAAVGDFLCRHDGRP